MVYRIVSTDGGASYTASAQNSLLWFEQYGDKYSPEVPPREYFISGYLPRYQKTQMVGYFQDSGDLRGIGVNASGHVLTDVEVDVSSGLFVVVQSGVQVVGASQISGAVQISGIVGVSGRVSILSGLVCVASGEVHIMSGVTSVSGNVVSISGEIRAHISGDHVFVESGVYLASGVGVLIQIPQSISINAPSNPQVIGSTSGGDILTSGNINLIIVKSRTTNSGDLYVGGHTAGHMPYSGRGFLLEPGEAMTINIQEMGYVHVFAEVSGDLATYLGT